MAELQEMRDRFRRLCRDEFGESPEESVREGSEPPDQDETQKTPEKDVLTACGLELLKDVIPEEDLRTTDLQSEFDRCVGEASEHFFLCLVGIITSSASAALMMTMLMLLLLLWLLHPFDDRVQIRIHIREQDLHQAIQNLGLETVQLPRKIRHDHGFTLEVIQSERHRFLPQTTTDQDIHSRGPVQELDTATDLPSTEQHTPVSSSSSSGRRGRGDTEGRSEGEFCGRCLRIPEDLMMQESQPSEIHGLEFLHPERIDHDQLMTVRQRQEDLSSDPSQTCDLCPGVPETQRPETCEAEWFLVGSSRGRRR